MGLLRIISSPKPQRLSKATGSMDQLSSTRTIRKVSCVVVTADDF